MKPLHLAYTAFWSCIIAIASSPTVYGQISAGGTPYSFTVKIGGSVDVTIAPSVDHTELKHEDDLLRAEAILAGRQYRPRFAKALAVDLGLDNAGRWSVLPNGDRLWRLRLKSAGALAISLIFDDFYLPDGSTFFVYNQQRDHVIGAFTSQNNKPYGRFSTIPVKGEESILEYYEPAATKTMGRIHLVKVVHSYRNPPGIKMEAVGKTLGYGDSGSCEVDINCSAGSSWQDEKHSVVMILLDSSTRWCTGNLLNNASQDWTPYLLTAHHCADMDRNGTLTASELADIEDWLFWFEYESHTCDGPDAVGYGTVSGATWRSKRADTDMLLLELSIKPLASYKPYYAGWSRSSSAATSIAVIHHPSGDVKKISLDDETVTLEKFDPDEDDAPRYWKVGDMDTGDVEGGSSGAGLFDQNGRIVGQHTGEGDYDHADCATLVDRVAYWGAFHLSWDPAESATNAELRYWLDSGNSNTTLNTVQGYPSPPSNLSISNPTDDGEFLELSWTGSSTSGVTYKVERCRAATQYGPCSPYFSVIGTTSSTSYTDTQVMIEVPAAPGEPYQRYRVRAIKNSVYSLYTNEVQMIATSLSKSVPDDFVLFENYPNPFNPSTTVSFGLPRESRVILSIFGLDGKEVAKIADRTFGAGIHSVNLVASDITSGLYFYRMEAGSFVDVKRMTLLK